MSRLLSIFSCPHISSVLKSLSLVELYEWHDIQVAMVFKALTEMQSQKITLLYSVLKIPPRYDTLIVISAKNIMNMDFKRALSFDI